MSTETVELRKQLQRLKDKETRLEADLAIREHPELEAAVYEIIMPLAKVRKVEKELRALEGRNDLRKVTAYSTHVDFYERKIQAMKKVIADKDSSLARQQLRFYKAKLEVIFDSGIKTTIPGHEGIKLKLANAKAELRDAYSKWTNKLIKHQFNLDHLLPAVADYLGCEKTD